MCMCVSVCVCMCACLHVCVSVCTWTTVCVWLLLLDESFVSSEILLTKLSNLPACMKALFQWGGGAANLANSIWVWGTLLGTTCTQCKIPSARIWNCRICLLYLGFIHLYISCFIAFPENELFKFSSCVFTGHGAVFRKYLFCTKHISPSPSCPH